MPHKKKKKVQEMDSAYSTAPKAHTRPKTIMPFIVIQYMV